MYPSHDHTIDRDNDAEMVVDARIINDMKSHLSDVEFWALVEHLYVVGRDKGKVSDPPRRLADDWTVRRNFGDDE
jgi:hypothetical protein